MQPTIRTKFEQKNLTNKININFLLVKIESFKQISLQTLCNNYKGWETDKLTKSVTWA